MIELWMTFVGIVMAVASAPQVIKLYVRKSSDDISLRMWYFIGFGQLNWLAYGFYIDSLSLIVTNIACIAMNIAIISLSIKYRKEINMKIAIRTSYDGAFGLSTEAMKLAVVRKALCVNIEAVDDWELRDNDSLRDVGDGFSIVVYNLNGSEEIVNEDVLFKSDEVFWFDGDDTEYRNDPILIGIIEELGVKANGKGTELGIIEVPDGIEYWIEWENDQHGAEIVVEEHRTWP